MMKAKVRCAAPPMTASGRKSNKRSAANGYEILFAGRVVGFQPACALAHNNAWLFTACQHDILYYAYNKAAEFTLKYGKDR